MITNETPDSRGERPLSNTASGCLYASVVVAVSAGLLFLNALLCLSIYAVLPKQGDQNMIARAGQMFFFVAPIVLLVIEWNLLDRIQRLFRSSG